MNFPRLRSKPDFFCFLIAGVATGVSVRMFGGDVSNRAQPKWASLEIKLEIKNEFKVQPPKQAETVRTWLAYGWLPLGCSLAEYLQQGVQGNGQEQKALLELTTATGYKGLNHKVDYYFGNLDERRVTWSRGRDLDHGSRCRNMGGECAREDVRRDRRQTVYRLDALVSTYAEATK